VLDDVEFVLFEKNADGEVVERKYQGAWLIVDKQWLPGVVMHNPTNQASPQAPKGKFGFHSGLSL
jgi:hypothetical protein